MPRTFHLLLFLSISWLGEAGNPNKFDIFGNITCNLGRPYKYEITVRELDLTSHDDKVGRNPWVTSTTSPTPYYIQASDTDDGPWNHYFELDLFILHDCGPGQMAATFNVGEFWINENGYTHQKCVNVDLTNAGWPYKW